MPSLFYKNRYKRWFVCSSTFIIVLYAFDLMLMTDFGYYLGIFKHYPKDVYTYDIDTPGCKIPSMNPYDRQIAKYIFRPRSFNQCSTLQPLVSSNATSLIVNKDLINDYNVTNITKLYCSYLPFWRIDPGGINATDSAVKFGRRVFFKNEVNIFHEFIRVQCFLDWKIIYDDWRFFFPRKSRLRRKNKENWFNVLVIGIDSMSRMNLHRQMQKTLRTLRTFRSVEYLGFNRLEENTFPNLMALFTGDRIDELKCWTKPSGRFDGCDFIWRHFRNSGYVTAFGEDKAATSIFNHGGKIGFRKQPTDYYWNTFGRRATWKSSTSSACAGPRALYKVWLEYITKFMTLKRIKKFGFFHSVSVSHRDVNTASLADADFSKFFYDLNQSGVLNKTILFFFSDHGTRFGDIRQTHQGYMEENLPFLISVFPSAFIKLYPEAFQNFNFNKGRLTTLLDLHETLLDLLTPQVITDKQIGERMRNTEKHDIQVSLFLRLPNNRTCDSIEITNIFCACHKEIIVDKNDAVVVKIANYLVEYLNSFIVNVANCRQLFLREVIGATRMDYGIDDLNILGRHTNYKIMFKTIPGNGTFEGHVRCTICENPSTYLIRGPINRLDEYKSFRNKRCVSDANLMPYCFCD